jgi:hypothetical protein
MSPDWSPATHVSSAQYVPQNRQQPSATVPKDTSECGGGGCPPTDTARIQLRQPPVTFMGPAFGATSAQSDATGSWTTTMLVTTGFVPGGDPIGAQVVTAECDDPIPGGFLTAFNYPAVPFTITAPGDSTVLPVAPVAQAQPGAR